MQPLPIQFFLVLKSVSHWKSEWSQPTSFLTDTTDESFKVTGPPSNYGELLKQRRYILELNEFDDISLTSKVSAHNMDNESSLDERL